MSTKAAVRMQQAARQPYAAVQQEVRRNLRAWRGLYGALRSGRAIDPVTWQKKIRREWERKIRA